MAGFAGPNLATAVHACNGIGFIGAMKDTKNMRPALTKASQLLFSSPAPPANETLPLGIGVLVFAQQVESEEVMRVLADFRPAAVWLFAANGGAEYVDWSQRIRAASPESKIWIQVSSVRAAVEAVRDCKADVVVLQGSDAGGHGKSPGASILSLIPETADALEKEGLAGKTVLVAAGGIVDGRSVAAALAVGAQGVVMGTAFLAAEEVEIHTAYRDAVLKTRDGGVNTIRSTIFDELPGKNVWPGGYDGRAVVAQSYKDHVGGMKVEELRELYKRAKVEETQGYGPDNRRAAIWAGTGVGLVNEVRPAKVIIEESRRDAKKVLQKAIAHL